MDLRLPQLGDIMTEGRVAAWLQRDGATVEAGQALYDLETDKVNFTVEAPSAGVLHHVVAAGETVAVGTVVGRLVAAGEAEVAPAPLVEVRATPAARALARELGVDLTTIAATGRIRAADVRTAADAVAGATRFLPYDGHRRAIGENMLRSHRTAAPVTLTTEVGVDVALARRDGTTLTQVVVRACAVALREHPLLNARLVDDRIELPATVDIGVAVDREDGLVVPVLRAADRLRLAEIATRLGDLIDRARKGQLMRTEVGGATFMVTSLLRTVVDAFTPILDPPQAAILGIGRVREIAAFEDHAVVRRQVITLSLTFDHRIADGGPAARFLGRVVELISDPAGL
jgi:pyruvate dehydrogenase E2 component (dihydrolipoamide acetyltransferase)